MATQADQQTDGAHKGEFEEQQIVLSVDCTQRTGYDCEFVERPHETDAYCPICLLVLREPHQVTCCGKSYCRSCIEWVELQKKPCPTCNKQRFSFFADKRLKQVLCAFRVYCSHKKEGCQWTGELGELDKHLNVNPKLHEQLVGCEFTEVECHHCCDLFQRRYVTTHQIEECLRRPFSCDYCGNYGADFEDVTTKHWPVCGSHPVPCPNKCGACPERQNIEHHVHNDCSLTVVDCGYCCVGCKVQLSHKDMSVHLAQDMADHIALVATHSQREIKQKDEQIAELKKEAQRKSHQLRTDFTYALQQQLQTQDRILRETEERMTRQLRVAEDRIARQLAANRESGKYNFGITVGLLVVVAAIIAGVGCILYQETENLKNGTRNLIYESELASKEAMEKMKQKIDLLQNEIAFNLEKNYTIVQFEEQAKMIKKELNNLYQENEDLTSENRHMRQKLNQTEKTSKKAKAQMEQEFDLLKKTQRDIASKLHTTVQLEVHAKTVKWIEILYEQFEDLKSRSINLTQEIELTSRKARAEMKQEVDSLKKMQKDIASKLEDTTVQLETVQAKAIKQDQVIEDWKSRSENLMQVINRTEVTSKTASVNMEQEIDLVKKQQKQIASELEDAIQRQVQFSTILAEHGTPVPPFEIFMPEFLKHKAAGDVWYSKPFYTHLHGYKLCLAVYANGRGSVENSQVSVFIRLMRGEYDNELAWPFQGNLSVYILNQFEDRGHHKMLVNFTKNGDRVIKTDRAVNGVGRRSFISHRQLSYENSMHTQYLKHDSLRFRVADVEVGVDTVAVVPTDIIMTDFEGHKKNSDQWFSEPFYTHPGGYKMCLRVYANTWDSHVGVYVRLMQSKYDDQLEWPFRGDITIQLLNQKRDEGHWEKTIPFDDGVYGADARVVGQEIQAYGRGKPWFIAHTELNTKDNEYLKNNCLKFQVRKVFVKRIQNY